MQAQMAPKGRNSNQSGSPDSGEPLMLAVGKLRRPHGVSGEIQMEVYTDFPERLQPQKTVYVGPAYEPLQIASLRRHNLLILISFDGFEDRDQVGRLRNQIVYVSGESLPALPEGEYYHHELLGLAVFNESGVGLGVLTEILETGANDVYLVETAEGKELMLPAIDDVILAIDLAERTMRVRPPLWEGEDS